MDHFVLGVLTAVASRRETITVSEVCRLARLPEKGLPDVLQEIRSAFLPEEPDLVSVVVPSHGTIGLGEGDAVLWRCRVLAAWEFWSRVRNG